MNAEIKVVQVLTHPDTVSGTSLFNDGSKEYWSEGAGSPVQHVSSGGTLFVYAENAPPPELAPYRAAQRLYEEQGGSDADRTMKLGEIRQHEYFRQYSYVAKPHNVF